MDDTKYADSEGIETTNYALKYKLSKTSYVGVGFTEGEETHDDNTDTRTEYEETMIGGGRKLTDGASLGYYFTKTEASHTGSEAAEVSALGITLNLRF